VGDEVAAEIEARVLSRAVEQTTGEIRAKVRRLVKRLDPEALARRREHAVRQRDVHLVPTDEGTAHLSGLDLPADAATAARNRVNAIATGLKTDGDRRGIGQLRADVFLGLLSGTLTTTEPPADPTRHQTTGTPDRHEDGWTGLDDAIADTIAQIARDHLTTLSGGLPVRGVRHQEFGELLAWAGRDRLDCPADGLSGRSVSERYQGLGELIAQAGQRITDCLAGLKGRWCTSALTTDPGQDRRDYGGEQEQGEGQQGRPGEPGEQGQQGRDGRPDGHGHDGYRVPARMRRLIEHRDRRCGFPGCRRPVRHCDADHTIAYHRGGTTCPCNLAMLCRHHHTLKQTPGWRLHQLWPGVLLWISPTGHWRITTPPDRE
jgi:Domain of unknown function (DUF222)